MNNVIEIRGLTKIYSSGLNRQGVKALDDVSFNVPEGIIFSLLGPNGAGKTTLVKALLGIIQANYSEINLLGKPVTEISVKERIGYLPENHKFPPYLNGQQLLKFTAELCNYKGNDFKERSKFLLKKVKMLKWRKTKIKTYSKGMLQRLGLAQAVIHNPDLIFLDEPTDGVDPIGRKEIRDFLVDLKKEGKTIFINSHLLSEVEMISDSIAILNKGKVVYSGSVEALTTSKETYEVKVNKKPDDYILYKLKDFNIIETGENKIVFKVENEEEINRIVDILRENNYVILGLNSKKSSLEDKFISLVQRTDN
jgi:ABC-2 type transport system ATP-binding protein